MMRSLTHPLDVLKIRMQMQADHSSVSKYQGVLGGFRTLYSDEGMRGLVRGHNTSQVMSVTQGLVQFWSYEQLSKMSRKVSYLRENAFIRHFLCGGFAGCLACVAAHPFDVVRAQVMTADHRSGHAQMTTVQGVRHVFTMEGWKGLTRGLSFALIEAFPLMGFKFFFYKYLNALALSVQQHRKIDCSKSGLGGGFMLVNGALAGGISKIVVYPVNLLTKRMQLQAFLQELEGSGSRPDCPTVRHCITTTFQKEGVRGFYKGMAPTLLKAVLANSIYFTIYDLFARHFIAPLQGSGES